MTNLYPNIVIFYAHQFCSQFLWDLILSVLFPNKLWGIIYYIPISLKDLSISKCNMAVTSGVNCFLSTKLVTRGLHIIRRWSILSISVDWLSPNFRFCKVSSSNRLSLLFEGMYRLYLLKHTNESWSIDDWSLKWLNSSCCSF